MQAQLEERIRSLERKLASVTTERDDLQKDVEALCLNKGGSMFSSSYVLTERVSATDAELRAAKAEIAALSRVQADLCAAQIAKSAAEHLAAKQHQKMEDMDKELKHYQVQLSQMISELDQARFDSEQSRRQVSQYETEVREARKQVGELEDQQADLREKLAVAIGTQQRQQQELEARQTEWEETKKQLYVLTEERKKTDGAIAALQAKLVLHQADLDRTQRLLQQSHQAEARFRVRLQETVASSAQLQGTVSGQAEFISKQHDEMASLQSQVAAAQREAEQSMSELARSQAKMRDLEHQVCSQRQALEEEMRSSQSDTRLLQLQVQNLQAQVAEQQQKGRVRADSCDPPQKGQGDARQAQDNRFLGHSGVDEDQQEQMEILTHLVRDLKIKLAEATQAKVEALMRLAAAGPSADDSPRAGGLDLNRPAWLKSQASAPPDTGSFSQSWMEALMNNQWNAKFLGTSLAAVTSASPKRLSNSPSSWDSHKAPGKDAAPAVAAEATTSKQLTSPVINLCGQNNKREDELFLSASEPAAVISDLKPNSLTQKDLPDATLAASSLQGSEMAVKQAETLRQAATMARSYAGQLWTAGESIWGRDIDAAKKWSAITSLSQLHEELNREQAANGIFKLQLPGIANLSKTEQGAAPEAAMESPLEVKQGIMHLAEFGLHALEQFSRQEALSSLGMQFVPSTGTVGGVPGPWV